MVLRVSTLIKDHKRWERSYEYSSGKTKHSNVFSCTKQFMGCTCVKYMYIFCKFQLGSPLLLNDEELPPCFVGL